MRADDVNSANPYERIRALISTAERSSAISLDLALSALYLAKDDVSETVAALKKRRAHSFTEPGLPLDDEPAVSNGVPMPQPSLVS